MNARLLYVISLLVGLALFGYVALDVAAQGPKPRAATSVAGTGFTYQGQLKSSGAPVNGACDIAFRLYDAASSGNMVGSAMTPTVPITNGLFTTVLDFGSGAVTGDSRWLDMQVRCPAGGGTFTALTPRLALTPVPIALSLPGLWTQPNATSPNLIGGYSGNVISPSVVGGTIGGGGFSAGPNSVLGNYGTVGGGANNTAGDFQATVGGGRDNTAGGLDATIGGGQGNTASNFAAAIGGGTTNVAGGYAATIGGGASNNAGSQYATIGGGASNVAGDYAATVGGGTSNNASGHTASIGGGQSNIASDINTSVGGGASNTAANVNATVGGGSSNTAAGIASTISGGASNTIFPFDAGYATIGGGFNNAANHAGATIAGGAGNFASGYTSTIGGGLNNATSQQYATIGGGVANTASGVESTIGGGGNNTVSADDSVVGGGSLNTALSYNATVGGGYSNTVSHPFSTVAGGDSNRGDGDGAAIGGGAGNIVTNTYATIGGGYNNTATGVAATIPGGALNLAQGAHSFAAGYRAKALDDGSFVWADSAQFDLFSVGSDSFSARAAGGFWLFMSPSHLEGPYCVVTASSPSWNCSSDRNLKDNFAALDPQAVLQQLNRVPISRWTMKGSTVPHIGPMAQDFYAAFGLGEDDKHIGSGDAQGVALAAIQGLYQVVQEKDGQIAAQQKQIADLQKQNASIEARLSALEERTSAGNPASNAQPAILALGMAVVFGFVYHKQRTR